MTWAHRLYVFFAACILHACQFSVPHNDDGIEDSLVSTSTSFGKNNVSPPADPIPNLTDTTKTDRTRNIDTAVLTPASEIKIGTANPNDVIRFAETLIGVPYVYASSNPKVGFDCSGFITYVFNHFKIPVPRSSIDFTNVGKTIPVEQAKRGDIILFTGTNPEERHVGHMGLVVSNDDSLRFIHSSSGKAMGVTITPLNKYYMTRFVKTIRIFPQNDK